METAISVGSPQCTDAAAAEAQNKTAGRAAIFLVLFNICSRAAFKFDVKPASQIDLI